MKILVVKMIGRFASTNAVAELQPKVGRALSKHSDRPGFQHEDFGFAQSLK